MYIYIYICNKIKGRKEALWCGAEQWYAITNLAGGGDSEPRRGAPPPAVILVLEFLLIRTTSDSTRMRELRRFVKLYKKGSVDSTASLV